MLIEPGGGGGVRRGKEDLRPRERFFLAGGTASLVEVTASARALRCA